MPLLAVDSHLVAIVPGALAERLSPILPIAVVELPFKRFTIETEDILGTRQESDAAHGWFRELTAQALAKVMGGDPTSG